MGNGRRMLFSVIVGDYEENEEIKPIEHTNSLDEVYSDDGDIIEVFGMTLHTLNDAARERYRVPDNIKGILVIGIELESIASDKGIHRGDVVTFIDDKRIFSVDDILSSINS